MRFASCPFPTDADWYWSCGLNIRRGRRSVLRSFRDVVIFDVPIEPPVSHKIQIKRNISVLTVSYYKSAICGRSVGHVLTINR
jgi:hypothetical protein